MIPMNVSQMCCVVLCYTKAVILGIRISTFGMCAVCACAELHAQVAAFNDHFQ